MIVPRQSQAIPAAAVDNDVSESRCSAFSSPPRSATSESQIIYAYLINTNAVTEPNVLLLFQPVAYCVTTIFFIEFKLSIHKTLYENTVFIEIDQNIWGNLTNFNAKVYIYRTDEK